MCIREGEKYFFSRVSPSPGLILHYAGLAEFLSSLQLEQSTILLFSISSLDGHKILQRLTSQAYDSHRITPTCRPPLAPMIPTHQALPNKNVNLVSQDLHRLLTTKSGSITSLIFLPTNKYKRVMCVQENLKIILLLVCYIFYPLSFDLSIDVYIFFFYQLNYLHLFIPNSNLSQYSTMKTPLINFNIKIFTFILNDKIFLFFIIKIL